MSPLFQGRGTCSAHCCLLLKDYQQRKFSKVLPTQVSIWGQYQCPLISATESLACRLSLLWLITQPVVFRKNNLALGAFMYVTQAGTSLTLYKAIAPTKEETCLSQLETNNPCFPANVSRPSAVGSSSPQIPAQTSGAHTKVMLPTPRPVSTILSLLCILPSSPLPVPARMCTCWVLV